MTNVLTDSDLRPKHINQRSNSEKRIYQNIGNRRSIQGKSIQKIKTVAKSSKSPKSKSKIPISVHSKLVTKQIIKRKQKSKTKAKNSSSTSNSSSQNSSRRRSKSRKSQNLNPTPYQIDDSQSESDCEIIENVTPVIILDDDYINEQKSQTCKSGISTTVTSNISNDIIETTNTTVSESNQTNKSNQTNETNEPELESTLDSSSSIPNPSSEPLFYIDKNPCTTFDAPIYQVNILKPNQFEEMSSNVRNIRINGPVNFTNKENEATNITIFTPNPMLSSTRVNDLFDGLDKNTSPSSNDEATNFHISINSTCEFGASRVVTASRVSPISSDQPLTSIRNNNNIEMERPIKRKAEQNADDEPALKKSTDNVIAFNKSNSKKNTNEIIVLNDTMSDIDEDSVVFVSETIHEKRNRTTIIDQSNKHKALDYISINETNNQKSQSTRAKRRRGKRSKDIEKKQQQQKQQQQQRNSAKNRLQNRFDAKNAKNSSNSFETYASIVQNGTPKQTCESNNVKKKKQMIGYEKEKQLFEEKPELFEKRQIIIDGSNVARTHGRKDNSYSIKGIEICLKHFENLGFEVKAFVPQMRLKRNQSTDPDTLERLINAGKVISTPCKKLPGQNSTCYDDRLILEAAELAEAAIISNDNYADLLSETPERDEIIKERVVGFVFFNDFIMIPKDPYGKNGRTLQLILHKLKPEAKIDEKYLEK